MTFTIGTQLIRRDGGASGSVKFLFPIPSPLPVFLRTYQVQGTTRDSATVPCICLRAGIYVRTRSKGLSFVTPRGTRQTATAMVKPSGVVESVVADMIRAVEVELFQVNVDEQRQHRYGIVLK